MKITSKIFHLPPYVSTSWAHVRAIYLKGSDLVVCLAAGTVIELPGLSPEILEQIFNAHSAYLEGQNSQTQSAPERPSPLHFTHVKGNPLLAPGKHSTEVEGDPSLSFGLGTFDSLGSALHHNASQANMPDLPKEILNKISAIAKIVAPDDVQSLPKPEPHCNCTYCQIAKAVHQGLDNEIATVEVIKQNPDIEEVVTDADLTFQQWDITQTGEKLFSVSNRLDSKEKFSVYLGHPVGCTCGRTGCEHILAVLKS